MKRIGLKWGGAGLLVLLSASMAGAVGFGVQGNAGYGHAFWTFVNPGIETIERDTDTVITGGGLTLDTNLAANHLFNYRANLSYQSVTYLKYQPPEFFFTNRYFPPADFAMTQIELVNSFGFGVVRTPTTRFWLGPQLSLVSITGDKTLQGRMNGYAFTRTDKFSLLGAGIGAAMGVNINTPGAVTLGFEFGARANFISGTDDYRMTGGYTDAHKITVAQITPQAYLAMTLMFRGDQYAKPE